MSPALHACETPTEPTHRILLPLPPLAGTPTNCCPYCGAPPVGLHQPRSFVCGAAWSGPAGRLPCGAPPASLLLARLRRWFLNHQLYAAAAQLRRVLPREPTAHIDGGLGWLLPREPRPEPRPRCPCCGAPVRSRDPDCWHYACGCAALRINPEDESPQRWMACLPCQQPSLLAILDAVACLPDNPLDPLDNACLQQTLTRSCWL